MSSVVISGDTSGAITLSAPAVSGTNTATLPAATGTVMVSGNMPAFSVYNSADQSYSGATNTKVVFNTEEFDTNNNFASSRFTPTVAGYYQINLVLGESNSGNLYYNYIQFYKNGSVDQIAIYGPYGASQQASYGNFSTIVYLNGSTDYIELYGIVSGTGSSSFSGGASYFTVMSGSLIRGA